MGKELNARPGRISYKVAAKLTKKFRESRGLLNIQQGYYFSRESIEALLRQIDNQGVIGIKVYMGYGEDVSHQGNEKIPGLHFQPLIVAVDQEGDDLVKAVIPDNDDDDKTLIIAPESIGGRAPAPGPWCPPCGKPNKLNSD